MQTLLTRHASEVQGVLSGFDRVRFRGTVRWLASVRGLWAWLSHRSVLLKEFTSYAQGLTDQLKQATAELAKQHARPLHYRNC